VGNDLRKQGVIRDVITYHQTPIGALIAGFFSEIIPVNTGPCKYRAFAGRDLQTEVITWVFSTLYLTFTGIFLFAERNPHKQASFAERNLQREGI